MSRVILWLLGGLGFFALIAAALYFGLSGIPAGDSAQNKVDNEKAAGRGLDYDRCSQPDCTICAVAQTYRTLSKRREGRSS